MKTDKVDDRSSSPQVAPQRTSSSRPVRRVEERARPSGETRTDAAMSGTVRALIDGYVNPPRSDMALMTGPRCLPLLDFLSTEIVPQLDEAGGIRGNATIILDAERDQRREIERRMRERSSS